jgi:hypothetical protein
MAREQVYEVGAEPEQQPQPPQNFLNKNKYLVIGAIVIIFIVFFGCALSGLMSPAPHKAISIEISYNGSWTGSIGDSGGQRSVSGTGARSYDMSGGIVVAVIQKDDDSTKTLTVQILEGSDVVEVQSTAAAYGVVSTSHNFD